MKLSPAETQMMDLIRNRGGSLCPGDEYAPNRDGQRLLRRMERRGLISIEQTDDGFRYSTEDWWHAHSS